MVNSQNITSDDVISFWFNEITPQDWWKKSDAFDQKITSNFKTIYEKAAAGELYQWRDQPLSSLAEVIILDQFPRNMFRDTAKAFATDVLALCLTQNAVDKGFDKELNPSQRAFLYMPMMHSESLEIHEQAVKFFNAPGMENNLNFELKHKAIIDRFGRYPHRNGILARTSTQLEIDFLKEPNSSF